MSIRRMYLFFACLLFALSHRRYIVLLYHYLFTTSVYYFLPWFHHHHMITALGDFPLPTSVVVTTPLIGWSWYLLMSTLIVDNLSASIRALYSLVSIRSSGWVDVRCFVYLIAGHSVSAIGYQTLRVDIQEGELSSRSGNTLPWDGPVRFGTPVRSLQNTLGDRVDPRCSTP